MKIQLRYIIFFIWFISLIIIGVVFFEPVYYDKDIVQNKAWGDALKNMMALVIPQLTIVISFIFQNNDETVLKSDLVSSDGGSKLALFLIVFYTLILNALTWFFFKFDSERLGFYPQGVKSVTLILGLLSFMPASAMAYLFKQKRKKPSKKGNIK